MFKRSAFVLAALTMAFGAQAASLTEAQAQVCSATPATLNAVVKGLAVNTSTSNIAQALINCNKDFEAAIAALRGAGVPDVAISNTLYELVPADKLASLDAATLTASLPLPATGAGRNSPGAAPGVGNGNGATIAPFVSGGNAFGGGGRGNASAN